MFQTLMHIIGICPDGACHIDLMDLFIAGAATGWLFTCRTYLGWLADLWRKP